MTISDQSQVSNILTVEVADLRPAKNLGRNLYTKYLQIYSGVVVSF